LTQWNDSEEILGRLRTDVDIGDLVGSTQILWKLCPKFQNMIVTGIEEAMPGDMSVVFHVKPRRGFDGEERTVILSAQYILDSFNEDTI
jgi:hypothetical protein